MDSLRKGINQEGSVSMKWMMMTVLACMLAATALCASARAGTLSGTIEDEKTHEKLIGANVLVVGTNVGTVTDLDGRFVLDNVPAGTYSIRVSYMGYSAKVITGVEIKDGDATRLKIGIAPVDGASTDDATRIDDTYVTAERVRNTNASILAERQRSAVIGDAISAEQISKSPDGTSGDALKRVTGLSVVDNKFVFIRGITDRYNTTTLNGVGVTSTDTDVDKKSFSFDLVPASLLANTVVVKTATPDLPGDFSGGMVQVNTLDFPSERVINVTASQSYDRSSTGKDFIATSGGGRDWLGFDDGYRDLPTGLEGRELAKALPNRWRTWNDQAPYNGSYALSYGDRHEIGGAQEVGYVASLVYKNEFSVEEYEQKPEFMGVPLFSLEGTRYVNEILWGALVNLNYKPGRDHKLSFKNNLNRSAEDKVSVQTGDMVSATDVTAQTIEWDERYLHLNQVGGEHAFGFAGDLSVEWKAYTSKSEAEEPDRKYVLYALDPRGNNLMKENFRTWSNLAEDTRGYNLDFTYPVGNARVKAGLYRDRRERDFAIDAFATTGPEDRRKTAIIADPIDRIFRPENYEPGLFKFEPITVFTGEYDGEHDLSAYYGMVDVPTRVFGQGLRIAGGARVEDSDQKVNTIKAVDDPVPFQARIDERDVLPSVNLTYQLTRRSNVRLAYYRSVNRPEFREMANVIYFDLDNNQLVQGNAALERAVIRNYDVRVEWFPGLGEVLAASYFYKDLKNAIEEELIPSPERYVRTWFNSENGRNFGYELEARQSLGFLGGGMRKLGAWMGGTADYTSNFTAIVNYTKVESEIEYVDEHTDADGNPIREIRTRMMQGQSPWMFNASLLFNEPRLDFSVNLLFNRFGRRLDAVGDERDQDVYEEPRDRWDLAFAKGITRWSRMKFTIKDMTADDEVLTSGPDGSVFERTKVGTTYSLSLSFNL
jgi:hypothetical protein